MIMSLTCSQVFHQHKLTSLELTIDVHILRLHWFVVIYSMINEKNHLRQSHKRHNGINNLADFQSHLNCYFLSSVAVHCHRCCRYYLYNGFRRLSLDRLSCNISWYVIPRTVPFCVVCLLQCVYDSVYVAWHRIGIFEND